MRRAAVRGACLGLALVLAGCGTMPGSFVAQVPTSGPVVQGDQLGQARGDQFIRVIARAPSPGMTPVEVVQGFLDASASFDNDHGVARQYLTPQASSAWRTDAGVRVYDGAPALTPGRAQVQFSAPEAAVILANGTYLTSEPGSSFDLTFGLERIDGEWRISEPPAGLVLSLADVDRAYRSYAVYFFDPTFQTLVPDPRMVPITGAGQASALIRQLFDGPSEWLLPAVRTGIPDGIELNVQSVPVEAGIARIDLSPGARLLDDAARQTLSQQIVWTLKQLPEVSAVEISAGGQPLSVPGVPTPQPRDAWPSVNPNAIPADSSAYAVRADAVVQLSGETFAAVPGPAGLGEVALVDIAVSLDSSVLAGIDSEGALWRTDLRSGGLLRELREPGPLTNLAFDRSGAVWVVQPETGLQVVAADGTAYPVAVSGLPPRTTILAAVPSRDGTRVALVLRRNGRTDLRLARVVRKGPNTLAEMRVSAPIRIESGLTDVVDVAWADGDSLAVLGSQGAGALQVIEVGLGRGALVPRGAPEAPVTLAAAPGSPTLVSAADGVIYEGAGGQWDLRLRGTAPAYPG